jgi:5'(3')-deoxyribonucleotidase
MVRVRYGRARRTRKMNGPVVGIDLDGVLGDQIAGVLPRIEKRHGVLLREEDVTDWRLKIGDTDIAEEIRLALNDPEYIFTMPVHRGAKALIRALFQTHRISIVTARPPSSAEATKRWLRRNRLWHDALVHVDEARKSAHEMDILIDDFLGNIREYLSNTEGRAFLVDRPWNQDRDEVAPWIEDGRLVTSNDLMSIPNLLSRPKSS